MSKIPVNVPNSKGAGILHNQAIVATGPLVFCSGQVPADLTTGEITKGDVSQHTVSISFQDMNTEEDADFETAPVHTKPQSGARRSWLKS